ncbi:MAG: hypothetical protein M0036_25300 [Desulfobacteraceae bacterium]|nr:hypothetical protein [Desulfobacteraceae bacterium]
MQWLCDGSRTIAAKIDAAHCQKIVPATLNFLGVAFGPANEKILAVAVGPQLPRVNSGAGRQAPWIELGNVRFELWTDRRFLVQGIVVTVASVDCSDIFHQVEIHDRSRIDHLWVGDQ